MDEKYYGEFDENGMQVKHAYSDSHMRKQFHVLESMFKYAVYPKRIMRENIMQYVKRRKKQKEIDLFEEVDTPVETISPEEYELLANMLTTPQKPEDCPVTRMPTGGPQTRRKPACMQGFRGITGT